MEGNRGEHEGKKKVLRKDSTRRILLLHGNLIPGTFASDSLCGDLEDTDD